MNLSIRSVFIVAVLSSFFVSCSHAKNAEKSSENQSSKAQNTAKNSSGEVTNYLGVKAPLNFDGGKYYLRHSNKKESGLILQEYLREEDRLSNFKRMITLMVLPEVSPNQWVQKTAMMLKRKKKRDPVTQFKAFKRKKSDSRIFLDFLLRKEQAYEWNIYKYLPIKYQGGDATLLVGFCIRHYAEPKAVPKEFLKGLKTKRPKMVEKMADFRQPVQSFKSKSQ